MLLRSSERSQSAQTQLQTMASIAAGLMSHLYLPRLPYDLLLVIVQHLGFSDIQALQMVRHIVGDIVLEYIYITIRFRHANPCVSSSSHDLCIAILLWSFYVDVARCR